MIRSNGLTFRVRVRGEVGNRAAREQREKVEKKG